MTVLLVPVEGPMVRMVSEYPIDVQQVLRDAGGQGVYVYFDLNVDEAWVGRLCFDFDNSLDTAVNERANLVLVMLTEQYMRITGPAVFVGIPDDVIDRIEREIT